MAFWWGINSLIRHAPSAVGVDCIPPAAGAGAVSPACVVASSPPSSVVNPLSPRNTCVQTQQPTTERTRPPFIDEALAWKSRDRFRYLKCSEEGGRAGSSSFSSSPLRRFDDRAGEGLWCLTGSRVVWNRLGSGGEEERGKWQGR